MFTSAVFLAILATVAAFAPVAKRSASSSLRMGFEGEIGAQPPLGLWDPLGLLKNADQARFERLRTVETKHGRIAQLAILGHLVTTAGARLPGNIAYGVPFSSIRTGLAAFDDIPAAGLLQLFVFIGILENGYSIVGKSIEEDIVRWQDANGWSAEKRRSKASIELNNGRAAQMGILALMVHEKLNNDPYIINTLLGAPVPFNQ